MGQVKGKVQLDTKERSDKGRTVMKSNKASIEKLVRIRTKHKSIIIEKFDKLKTIEKSNKF